MTSVLVGIAGPTSSGKTTLSLVLSQIFGDIATCCVHQDNYFAPKSAENVDCDCWDAVDLRRLLSDLKMVKYSGAMAQCEDNHTKLHSVFPENEDDLEKYKDLIVAIKERVKQWMKEETSKNARSRLSGDFSTLLPPNTNADPNPTTKALVIPKICLVDGFLLYSEPDANGEPAGSHHSTILDPKQDLMKLFDIKLFLPATKRLSRARRFAQTPYKDSPAGTRRSNQPWKTEKYFESTAWPNYIRENGFLFDDGVVERIPFGVTLRQGLTPGKADVFMMPVMDATVMETVEWAVEIILNELENIIRIRRYPTIPEEASMSGVTFVTADTIDTADGLDIEHTDHVEYTQELEKAVREKKTLSYLGIKKRVHQGIAAVVDFCKFEPKVTRKGKGKERDMDGDTVLGTPPTPILNAVCDCTFGRSLIGIC
jgi:hypothetical protein